MYCVWYTVVCYTYGNGSGRCGNFDNVDDAIDMALALMKDCGKGETFGVIVNWELNDNV